MEDPLRKTLRDESPYVRKTAAICVAKLFDLNPTMCLENGFLETLQELLGDPNPMVVANAVTALAEINQAAPETRAMQITPAALKKMLTALNECTEWGRVTILTTLADYKAVDVKESEHICERVSPQFQHVNPSVVLAAVKVVFLHMRFVSSELAQSYMKKMAPPLGKTAQAILCEKQWLICTVTLVSSASEVQYVALRNIDLLLQKEPDILSKEMRVFFCKYNDPPYLKLEKIEIMVRIANDKNVEQLLAELKEYAMEVDMDFVRRAVKAIGQVAIKIESATEKCVKTLLDLIGTRVHYVVQEAIVVIKDIFRKYPGYEGIIPTLCQCIDELDEPNARGALIWIVGEYAEKISNAGDILAGFMEGFNEEFTQVGAKLNTSSCRSLLLTSWQTQLQILTAVVKLFLKRPDQSQGLVQKVLQASTAESDNPDLRDRAYVYWRLLSSDPQITRSVVLSEHPPITTTIQSLPPALLNELINELSTLASVYHKPPITFLGQGRFASDAMQKAAIEEQQQEARENPIAATAAAAAISAGGATQQNNVENLLDFDFDGAAPASLQKEPSLRTSGLEELGGTTQRIASMDIPAAQNSTADDLAGIFGINGNRNGSVGLPAVHSNSAMRDDMANGFATLSVGGAKQPPPVGEQLKSHGQGQGAGSDLLDLI